jgi:O-antigen/teichoic acid export membrane protein
MTESSRAGGFSERVVILFVTQILTAGIGVFNAFLFARLAGPAGKGDYYLLVLLPNTTMVLAQLGLPTALGFYAARGKTHGIVRKALVLSVTLSAFALMVVVAFLPLLRESLLRGLQPSLVIASACAIPILMIATFTSSIVIALRALRWYAAVMLTQSVASSILLVLLVGVLGLGVPGALAMYLMTALIGMSGLWAGAARASAKVPQPSKVTFRELFRYGLPLYPASVTMFFSYRADVFLLAVLVADASVALGYYSMAVTLAEMVAYLPSAVSSIFLPHVAAAQREDADRHVLTVARVTLLLTGVTALALAPAATILIRVLLPAFVPALPALYVLLPGVVALSVAKVVGEYISGLGLTALTSAATVFAFIVNIAANLILIPILGIVGASAASLLSYSVSAIVMTLMAARLARAPLHRFWIPGPADVRLIVATVASLRTRVTRRNRASP